MPGFTPASSMTCSASPTRSRASSVEKASPTIGATSRCALGKRGSLGCARQAASATTAAAAAVLLHILDLYRFSRHPLRQRGGHEPVEIAVEHVAGAGRGHTGAQIFDQLVGLEHVGADLVAPADVGLGGVGGASLGLALLQLGFVQPGLQLLHRRRAVLVLRTLVLASDDDPRRDMGDPDGAVGRVDVLPARARRAIGVYPEILLLNLDVDIVVDFGVDPHAREAGVAACIGVVGA